MSSIFDDPDFYKLKLAGGRIMTLYDVCNDYSLEKAEDQNTDHLSPAAYKQVRVPEWGTVFIYREHNEVHYLLGDPGLDGEILPWNDEE